MPSSRRRGGPPALHHTFDEARFGAERTLNLRLSLPTGAEAVRRAEGWLREKQVAQAGEVLVITGRGKGSADGVPVVREAVVKLFSSLKRRGVVAEVREHNAGSFIVRLAPVTALFEVPRRNRERGAPMPRRDPAALRGLEPETRALLRRLASRALEDIGARADALQFEQDEMLRHFTALSAGIPEGAHRERRLRDAIARALEEYDERR